MFLFLCVISSRAVANQRKYVDDSVDDEKFKAPLSEGLVISSVWYCTRTIFAYLMFE